MIKSKRKLLLLVLSFVFTLSAFSVVSVVGTNANYKKAIEPYETSVTLTAADFTGEYFSKGCLNFHTVNIETNGNRIIFKGIDQNGDNVSTPPCLENLTGSIPNSDGTLSGQGYTNVEITGFDGTGYGQLGINSYEGQGTGWIAYQQFLPKADQSVVPPTSDTKPIAKYVYIFGKAGLDLSITSIKFVWSCSADKVEPEVPTIDENYLGEEYISFANESIDKDKYHISNGYSNGGMFLSNWNKNNLYLNNGIGEFSITNSDKNYSAEIRSYDYFTYGYFGARLKAISESGVVTSIFTYNGGEYDHDEIDIEILGKDTTKVQFNYYDDDVGDHEYIYDLGFDASSDYHDYGFKWDKNKITWFVDFKAVYQVDADVEECGRFYANCWAANNEIEGISQWLGEYAPSEEAVKAYFDYLSYAPLGDDSEIKLVSPISNEIVEITESKVSEYINAFKNKGASKENDYLLDINEVNTTSHTPRVSSYTTGKDISKGKPVELSFESSLSDKTYKVYVSINSDMSDAEIYDPDNNKVSLYNLFMATRYYWQVKTSDGEYESNVHSFVTADTARLIYTSKTTNIRDIGGKMTRSGKRIKQGLIYRGQELVHEAYTDSASGSHVATLDENSINTLVNELGIGLEMDFRSNTELIDSTNPSPAIEGMDYWQGSSVSSSGWVPSYNYISRDANNLKMYKAIFQQFLRAENYPIYFHCWGGLDRTGTVAFILEGLLGVSFTDMCIDYELSSFSGSGALRQRDVDYQSGGKGFKTMVTQLVNNTAANDKFVGYNPDGTNDIQEICTNILLKAGMTQNEINQLKLIMLE